MKTQTLFTGKWVQTTPLAIASPTQPILRPSQAHAFAASKDKQHVVLQAPTGWGKSLVIASLVLYKLLRNPNLRCIITVPQTLIARGFTGRDWKLRIAGKLVDWVVQHNLCHSQATNTVANLIQFLRGKHTSLGDRILVCTHATLAQAYKRLKQRRQLALLKNLVLWIDEGHHVKNAQVIDQDDPVSNGIGALATYCIKHGNHVGLATATYQRGDMRHILPDAVLKQFTHVKIPYDLYFEEVQPVETFEFNIIAGDTFRSLDSIFKTMRPTILYLAKRNSRYAGRCKYLEVKQIVRRLAKRLDATIRRDDHLIRVGDLKVLDLVTEKGRDARKAYLDDGGKVDIIIALDTCKEGFDWPEAERSIILGERHSIPELIQMIGRLFRRAEGKTHAEVYQILPAAVSNSQRFKDQRNAILTVVFSAMLLEDVFLPIPLSTDPEDRDSQDPTDRLISKIPTTEIAQALMRDFLTAVQGRSYEQSWRLAPSILKKHGITEADWEFIWKRLWRRFALLDRKLKGLRLDVPFEVLKTTDLTEGLLTLASGLCGATTFQELRRLISHKRHTLDECILIAEELATLQDDNMLPNPAWLEKNGYGFLVQAMYAYPEQFTHVLQCRREFRSDSEWVLYAEKLAQERGGILPCPTELIADGHRALVAAMQRFRESFAHIRQAKRNTVDKEELVTLAHRLAENNSGILPDPKELRKAGHLQLARAIHTHADWFADVQRKQRLRQPPSELALIELTRPDAKHLTAEEWMQVAEHLIKKYGALPGNAWLKKHGYQGLRHLIRKQPSLFADTPRLCSGPINKENWFQQWIPFAKQLQAEHGGTLPNDAWLEKRGYQGLIKAKRQYPDLFTFSDMTTADNENLVLS